MINLNILHKRIPCTIIVEDSTVKHLHGKSITNKTGNDNIILVKPFLGARTKAMKHYVSPDFKSVSLPEEITNEIISLALSMKEKGLQIAVLEIIS